MTKDNGMSNNPDVRSIASDVDIDALFEGNTVARLLPGGGYAIEARPPGGRQCGTCTLCCKLVPVPEIRKSAGERCRYQQAGKGCRVYRKPGFPRSCLLWSCRWLSDPDTAGLARPDRSHCVIDVMTDVVQLGGQQVPVIQIWVDPAFRDAWRTQEMKAYIERVGKSYGCMTIIRWDAESGLVVCPPALSEDGEWHERSGQSMPRDAFEAQILADARAAKLAQTKSN
jgi:hypothetical protein